MDNKDIQNLLDSLDEGPLGTRKDWQWDKSLYGTSHLSSKEIREKASKKSGDTQRGKKRGPRSQETKDKLSKTLKGREMPWLCSEEVIKKRTANTDYSSFQHQRVENYNWEARRKKISKPIIGYKILEYQRGKVGSPAKIIRKQKVGEWLNAYEAANELNLYQGDICNVLRPKSKSIQTKGYTFEYVS